jgi:hypothetical protein
VPALYPDPPQAPIEPALRLLRTVAAGPDADDDLAQACAVLLVQHDRLRTAANLSLRVRVAQRLYFEGRRPADLTTARELETALDRALRRIPWGPGEGPGTPLM